MAGSSNVLDRRRLGDRFRPRRARRTICLTCSEAVAKQRGVDLRPGAFERMARIVKMLWKKIGGWRADISFRSAGGSGGRVVIVVGACR
jgi:hypothetical protein